jgi:tripartite-type tricarboxylate transporter receptor subunit TctC
MRGFLLLLLGAWVLVVQGQNYPSRPIRLINPLGVGGTAEALSRTLAKGLSDGLGQPVVVETKSGAAGTIGAAYVAKSPPDGYTLLYGVTGTNSIAPAVYRKLPYDPARELAPISIAFSGPNVLIVSTSLNVGSLQELVALAKSQPGTIHFASAGNGSMSHLNAERLKALAGIDLLHVPYKGGGAAAPDLLSGRVQMMVETGASAIPLVRSGKLRPLAVTTPQRSRLLPEVPSVVELGMPELVAVVWGGVFAPGGTPRPILERIADAAARAARDPAYRELVTSLGNDAVSSTPDEFQAFVRDEAARYGEVVRRLGIEVE